MANTKSRSIHLFNFRGIDVFLHWSWFLVALIEIDSRAGSYSSITWNVLEYLALFLIVLLHEFGHAFACRQVGGRANRIVLWPLGGRCVCAAPSTAGRHAVEHRRRSFGERCLDACIPGAGLDELCVRLVAVDAGCSYLLGDACNH